MSDNKTTEAFGFRSAIGKMVNIWCVNFIYHGRLTAIGEEDILLEDCKVVFDFGPLQEAKGGKFKEAEYSVTKKRHVRKAAVESWEEAP